MQDENLLKVTQAEFDELSSRIVALKEELAEENANLEAARKEGDLRENSEFSRAKSAIGRIQEELESSEKLLSRMHIEEKSSTNQRVQPNTHVTLKCMNTGEEFTVQLVSTQGRPPMRVSLGSKLGTVLLDKRVGDIVKYVDNAFNQQQFKILNIQP